MSLHYKALITMDVGHVYRTVGGTNPGVSAPGGG